MERVPDKKRTWEQHPVRTLHACVETLASAFKGYLPWPEEKRGQVERGHEALIEDTVKRADACMTIIEHAATPPPVESPRDKELEGHKEAARIAQEDYARVRKELNERAMRDNGNVWYWQGDGDDHLESLTCPILISADKMRALLAPPSPIATPSWSANG